MPIFVNTGASAFGTGNLGGVAAGAATLTSGTVIFSNSNGVSFGLNGATVTASHNGLTSQSNQALSGSNGSFTFQTASFGSSNGMHFYTTNGSLVGSYTVPTVTNSAWTVSDAASSATVARLAFTNINGVTLSLSTGAAGSHTIVGSHNGLTSQSNQALSGSNGSFTFQTATFGSSNGMHFYTTNGSLVGSYTVPTQSNQTLGLYASSNTTAAASSTTVDARSLSVRGMGVASVGYSAGELVVSVPAGGGGLTNINVSAGTTSQNLSNVVFSNSNGVSFGLNGSTVTASVAGAPVTFNSTVFGKQLEWAMSSTSLVQNSLYIMPEILQDYVSGAIIKVPVLITNSSSAAASIQNGYTIQFGVYSRNATNSTVLTQHYSTSYTIAASHSSNVSWRISIITAVGNSTSYNSTSVNSAGLNLSASVHGSREWILPYSTLMSPGEWWFAYLQSSSSAGAVGNVLRVSNLIQSSVAQNRLGVSAGGTVDGIARNIGYGFYSATTGALPAGISMTQINIGATHPVYFFLSATV